MKALLLALTACAVEVDYTDVRPRDPVHCDDPAWFAITTYAGDAGEVLIPDAILTPGTSYQCSYGDPTPLTWTYWVRRRRDTGHLGSYGRFGPGTECRWYDAIDARYPALGRCP